MKLGESAADVTYLWKTTAPRQRRGYHYPLAGRDLVPYAGHMTEGGAYTLLGTFMALFATVTLLVLLLIFGCYFAFIALFAILQQMNIPTMDDFIDWLDKHIKYDWTDEHTVASTGHTWDILFTKPGSSRVALTCVFVVLAKKPIAAILIYLFTML